NAISKDYEALMSQFYDKNYDKVLITTPQLKPRVEELIVETKRESARSSLKEVNEAIQRLSDGKARTYLPGRVEQLETLSKEASGLFDEVKYVESKAISQRALDLNQQIVTEFDT